MLDQLIELFDAGGWAMYPLLGLSFLSIVLSFERLIFWLAVNRSGRSLGYLLEVARSGKTPTKLKKPGFFGSFLQSLRDRLHTDSAMQADLDAVSLELLEQTRSSIERFSVTLSTIITAAPMLGILGTVTGIIHSFELLGDSGGVTDPTAVAGGVAEALITTAFGLVVALVTLFPFVWARAHTDRCIGQLEALTAAVAAGMKKPE